MGLQSFRLKPAKRVSQIKPPPDKVFLKLNLLVDCEANLEKESECKACTNLLGKTTDYRNHEKDFRRMHRPSFSIVGNYRWELASRDFVGSCRHWFFGSCRHWFMLGAVITGFMLRVAVTGFTASAVVVGFSADCCHGLCIESCLCRRWYLQSMCFENGEDYQS